MARNFIINQEYSEQDYIVCLAWGKELLTVNSSLIDCFKAEIRQNTSGLSGYSNYERGLLRYPVITNGITPPRKVLFKETFNLGLYFNQIFIVRRGKQRGYRVPRIFRRYTLPTAGEASLLVPKYGTEIEGAFSYSPPNSNMFIVDAFDRQREFWFSGEYYESSLDSTIPYNRICDLGDSMMVVKDRRMDVSWQDIVKAEGSVFIGSGYDIGSTVPSGLSEDVIYKVCWVKTEGNNILYRITDQDITGKNIINNGSETYYEGVTPVDILDNGMGYSYMNNVSGDTVVSIITFPKLISIHGSQTFQANIKNPINGQVALSTVQGMEFVFAD